jgi:regulator of nucleoside diphosphate kinase
MIAQNLISSEQIVITEPDFDRLKRLLESPHYRSRRLTRRSPLRAELDRGKVVRPQEVADDVVTMHSRVRVRDLKTRSTGTYTLVYPEDADVLAGKLSVLAPLGTALLGMRVGQVVTFEAPGGARRVRVERILYQPEAAGDFHL